MDEFSGLDKGWNDPDMMMIGMNGLTDAMNRTHMSMWCMMNSPLMLGLDLRKVEKDDAIYRIIANKDLIAIDQDPLGIQAKRIWTTYDCSDPSKEYIRDNHRIDVLAKPLSGGRIALSVYNLSDKIAEEDIHIDLDLISEKLGSAFPEELRDAKTLLERNVWTGEESVVGKDLLGKLLVLDPHGNITLIIGRAG
jgi:alpha-galactosidase